MSDPEKQVTPISGHSFSRNVSGSTLHRDDYRRREMEATEAAIVPPEDADKTLGDDDFPDGGFEAWLVCGGVSFLSFSRFPRAVFVNGMWCSLFCLFAGSLLEYRNVSLAPVRPLPLSYLQLLITVFSLNL